MSSRPRTTQQATATRAPGILRSYLSARSNSGVRCALGCWTTVSRKQRFRLELGAAAGRLSSAAWGAGIVAVHPPPHAPTPPPVCPACPLPKVESGRCTLWRGHCRRRKPLPSPTERCRGPPTPSAAVPSEALQRGCGRVRVPERWRARFACSLSPSHLMQCCCGRSCSVFHSRGHAPAAARVRRAQRGQGGHGAGHARTRTRHHPSATAPCHTVTPPARPALPG